MMLYIGIDPGVNGGIAWQHERGDSVTVHAVKMPDSLRDLSDLLASLVETDNLKSCALEKVASRTGQGVRSIFTFGYQYGIVRASVVCHKIPLELVSAQRWQKPFGLIFPATVKRTQKKNQHKAKAQELFPHLKVTHATADALLICDYWRRYHKGVAE